MIAGKGTRKWVKSFTLAKTTENPIKSQLGFLENQDRGSRIEDKGSRVKNLIEFFFQEFLLENYHHYNHLNERFVLSIFCLS